MCGIVGYIGKRPAAKVLLSGLSKLEYRGYDSAGIAVRDNSKDPQIIKAKGKLKHLLEKTNNGNNVPGFVGIGHTRWATHGSPTETNAHPHCSDDKNVIGVHNGIIENYQELREKLIAKGYSFYSDTDTEVLIKLIDYYYKKYNIGPVDAINKMMVRARGSYAVACMFKDYPGEVWFAKKGSPLIIAKGEHETFLASDVPAILDYANKIYYVDDYECGCLKEDSITFYNLDGNDITSKKELVQIEWSADAASKGKYPHFMIKEIEEQPEVIKKTMDAYVRDEQIDFNECGLTRDMLKSFEQIYILACGSAYHTGMVAQYIIEKLCNVNVRVELASEYKYRDFPMNKNSLAIIISQSGETKDTYEAMMKAKDHGVKTMAIVNVKGSTITRDADINAYTYAGPEIAVATTKAYSCQLIVLYLLAVEMAKAKDLISSEKYKYYIDEIKSIPLKISKILADKEDVQKLSNVFVPLKDVFFIGRGIDYSLCMEGSLKLKEVTYIHSDAYAAGELKHGTISLIDNKVGVVSLLTQSSLFEKTLSNMVEIKAREGMVVALTTYGNYKVDEASDYQIYVPSIDDLFTSSLAIIPLQLLAYYVSVGKGIDPDKPKNLAKSVTVE